MTLAKTSHASNMMQQMHDLDKATYRVITTTEAF